MIKVEQPSLAVNDIALLKYTYRMQFSIIASRTDTPDFIVSRVLNVARMTTGKKLRFLIINCHGFYGKAPGSTVEKGGFGLHLGTGVQRRDIPKFQALRGFVDNIWITACGTARQTNAGPVGERSGGDGLMFCSEMARASGAYVVAATTLQDIQPNVPFGHVDDFEGVVLQFGPNGNVVWQHDYGRSWISALLHGSN